MVERRGLYVSPAFASGDELAAHLVFASEHGLNSLVVDFKDDRGRLTYDSQLPLAADIGAVEAQFALGDLLEAAHEAGMYLIARVVVFKDQRLYAYQDHRYAVRDARTGEPWGNRVDGQVREHWVDPYSPFVWEYNGAVAAELAERGVDEVQFDYIRFPSDGNTSVIDYRYRREGMTKIDAIESFLVLTRQRLDLPISIDLFGFNSWYRMGPWIGQNLEYLAPYVDAVSPMFYPSHFPAGFLAGLPYATRAQLIYQEGSRRARLLAGPGVAVRPYVQAFLIGEELQMQPDGYREYLLRQLQGAALGGASGFTLWNASNRYYMVDERLGQLD